VLKELQAEERLAQMVAPLEKELVESFRQRALRLMKKGLGRRAIIRRLRKIFRF
jgi:hypothetical protein